jgi:hypothetical protein
MRCIVPVSVFNGAAVLRSSTFSDHLVAGDFAMTNYAYFSTSTAYSPGQYAVSIDRKGVYKKITSSGASSISPSDDPTNWSYFGRTIKYSMFDMSAAPLPLMASGNFSSSVNAVMLIGCTFNSIKIEGLTINTSTLAETVNWTINDTATVSGTTPYVNGGLTSKVYDIPTVNVTFAFTGSIECIRVTINDSGSAGEIIFGTSIDLGATMKGYDVSINDYSVKNIDAFGVVSITRRGYSMKMNMVTWADNEAQADVIVSNLTKLRSTLLGFQGVAGRPSTHVLGYCKEWTCRSREDGRNIIQMSIEGVV